MASGRNAIGTDLDPLAVFATRVKTRRYDIRNLIQSTRLLHDRLEQLERSPQRYYLGQFQDIEPETAIRTCRAEGIWFPQIPNMFHWFRAYVVVDLARILHEIDDAAIPRSHCDFFRLAFAGIIRAASNADPVPVSGLEVTSHMLELDALGRIINPFDLFRIQVEKAIPGVAEFSALTPRGTWAKSRVGDATKLAALVKRNVNAIITSPPYHNAVDYHRRHTLELHWLGLMGAAAERQQRKNQYIGCTGVQRHPLVLSGTIESPLCAKWHAYIAKESSSRAAAFKHYVMCMQKMFAGAAQRLPVGGLALFVVGHSAWNGYEIPTSDLFEGLAGKNFGLVEKLWYPVRNRSMSYKRRNGADISKEYVLVFTKGG
jgi:hypothetical protein